MGFVTTAVLIFIAVLVYRLYRRVKSILSVVQATSKIAQDTVATIQENVEMASNFAHNTVATMQENIEMASNFAHDTVATMQEAIKPLLSILAVVQGVRVGFDGLSSMFKKESNKGGNSNE